MVRIPLDKICVRTGVLCPSCQAKIDRGLYEEWEVRVMRALLEAEEELGPLDLEYVKSLRVGRTLVVVVRLGGRGLPVGLEEALLRHLEGLGVSRVQVVAEWRGPEELVKNALAPARVLMVNRYYSPDGTVFLVAHVPRSDLDKLAGRIEVARSLLRSKYRGFDLDIRLVEAREGGVVEVERPDPSRVRSFLERLGP